MSIATGKFKVILFGLSKALPLAAKFYPAYAERLTERNLVAQIMARDEGVGRWFKIKNGRVTSGGGLHANPDVTIAFKNATLGADLLTPPFNWLNQINAQKDFKMTVDGPEDLSNWFAQTVMLLMSVRLDMGVPQKDGTIRYCNMANGGPLFVYVKDGKIVRTTLIDFDETDPQPWSITAKGVKLTPPRKTTLAPHGQNSKAIVYSPDRAL